MSPLRPVPHVADHAPAPSAAEGRDTAQNSQDAASTPVQVVGTRRDRNAWRQVRELGATVLRSALEKRRGSVTAWARRLGIDNSRIADWTGQELSKSPTIADVLLMEREDALRFVRALLVELTGAVASTDLRRDSHATVVAAARLLSVVDLALADDKLDDREISTLAAIGDDLGELADRLKALRKAK